MAYVTNSSWHIKLPLLIDVDAIQVMHKGPKKDKHMPKLMAVEPDIKFAWK
jgi:hypothetical protein